METDPIHALMENTEFIEQFNKVHHLFEHDGIGRISNIDTIPIDVLDEKIKVRRKFIDLQILNSLEQFKESLTPEILLRIQFSDGLIERLSYINQIRKLKRGLVDEGKYEAAAYLRIREKDLAGKINLKPCLDVFNKHITMLLKSSAAVHHFYAFSMVLSKKINEYYIFNYPEITEQIKAFCKNWIWEELLYRIGYSPEKDYTFLCKEYEINRQKLIEKLKLKI